MIDRFLPFLELIDRAKETLDSDSQNMFAPFDPQYMQSRMRTKVLFVLLSCLTVSYGVAFTRRRCRLIYCLGLAYFLSAIVFEVNFSIRAFSSVSVLEFIGYQVFFLGTLIYGCILVTHERTVVSYVRLNIRLLNSRQRRKLLLLLAGVTGHAASELLVSLYGQLTRVNEVISSQDQSIVVDFTFVIFQPFYFWDMFGSVLYGLMFFLMHLKHQRLLAHLDRQEWHPHVLIYRVLTQLKLDHLHFDRLLSMLPAIWLVNMVLGLGGVIELVAQIDKVRAVLIIFAKLFYFSAAYVLVNKCYSTFAQNIEQVKYKIIINKSSDKLGLAISLLDQMTGVCVTAGSLVKLDKSLFLPVIGSVLTYTFLFRDKLFSKISS